jgi:membrane protein
MPVMTGHPAQNTNKTHPMGEGVLAAAVEQASILGRSGMILVHSIKAFFGDNISSLGAALAFYTTVAVAPLLVLAISLAGFVIGEGNARQQVIVEIGRLAGPGAAAAVGAVQSQALTAKGLLASLVGLGTLVFGTLGVFTSLQNALNAIWRVAPKPTNGWWHFLRRRLFSLATVIGTGFLLLVSLVASAAISWLGAQSAQRLGLPFLPLELVNEAISLGIVTVLFALIFRMLPDVRVRMRHVWVGSAVTAILFTAGKAMLGFYLGRASLTSAYGAAGSLLILLLWCYYAAQIAFFGAEFTRVTAISDGGRDFSPLAAMDKRVDPA